MAGFQKLYTSENEYLYDLGKTTGYFDEEYYNLAKESGSDYQYLQMMASLKQTGVSDTFDPVLYSKLSGEERFNYLATENFMDKSSDDYTKSSQYFKQREKQIQNEEIYESLNGFEKTMNSIGGWLGNALLQVGGIVEGLIDAAIFSGSFLAQSTGVPALIGKADELAAGTKELIGKDTIGYNAAQASMNDWINKYTFIDKNVVTQAINDVTTGIVRMAPMLIPGVGQAGALLYYGSMMGNTAEQAITANPDINYGNLLLYTAGSVGLEAVTEWASGKLFGDDLISSLMKGQKYAPTGTIVKTIAKNFGTEALEESVAEIFGSLMYSGLVTGDPEDIASIEDIFYAAIIGGLTGAVMSGGQIATTRRMVVTQDGQLKYRSQLTEAEQKTAKKLKISQSWGLQNLIQQAQQALSTPDNVTQLMAETGKSVSQLQIENANEYEKAVAKDTETKTQQAKAILDLANLMSTIGVEQFTKSAELLKNNADLATEYVNNFLNHTDVANKKASEVFSANYPGKSFTPTAVPSKPNQALAESLRQAFPQLKVVFGTFGSEDGLPVRAINKGETYLFLDENMVSQKGYQQVLHETIRYQLADQLIQELNVLDTAETNGIVKLVTDLDVDYDKLTKEQKLSIAQILCFDPVNSKRLFKGANKTHAKIFGYITDQSEYVKKFGRQTEANKMRYHDLLQIRNMYLRNIAETIANDEDVQAVQEQYKLSEDELRNNITDKTEFTILNNTIAVMKQNLDKNVIARQEAIESLLQNRLDTNKTTPFEWNNLYNEAYYNEEFVQQIKLQQNEQDFELALKTHLLATYNVDFANIEHSTLVETLKNNVSLTELNKLAETLFTKEYLATNPDLQTAVADALYTMVQTEDTNLDSIMIRNNQLQGTGKLKFFKGDVYDKSNIVDTERRRVADKGSERQLGRVVSSTRTYIGQQITDFTINYQDETTLDKYQKELVKLTKQAYGLDLVFYAGPLKNLVDDTKNHTALGFVVDGTSKIYVRDDTSVTLEQIVSTIRHEITHKLIAQDESRYTRVKEKLETRIREEVEYWYGYYARPNNYGKTYNGNQTKIDEEVIVGYLTGELTAKNDIDQKYIEDEIISEFYDGVESKLWTNEIWSISKMNGEVAFKKETQKKQPNITEKDISKLASTEYRSGEKRKSKAKGYEDVEYEVASVMDYEEQNGDILRNVKTLDDLKTVLKAIETGVIGQLESGFILDLLQSTVLPFNFKGDRYTSAKALLDPIQSARVTQTAQEMASRSELFAETNPMKSLADELTDKYGTEIKPSNEMMIKWVPMYADRTNWLNRLKAEYEQIFDKRKHTKDPYAKQQYTLQLKDLRSMIQAVADNDTATILDLTIKQLQDTDENKAKNADKVQELVRDFVADLIAHTDGSSATPKYDPNKKYILKPEYTEKIADFWNKINAFRYLAMLSSPATWGRNALTNTLIVTNAIVEDGISGKIEKSKLLRNDSQANFTGDYDNNFSKFIEDRYTARINKDTKGDKYHTTEIEQVRQEWAAENDPMKKSKLLYTIKQLEQKALNDQPWTTRRVMRNLKNTMAGSINLISKSAYAECKTLYKGDTPQEILNNMRNTKSQLADLFEQVYVKNQGNDMVGVVDLASRLSNTSVILDEIYNNALYRGNKLLFKTDNILSKKISQIKKKHPMTAAFITMFLPFAKTSYNTTAYIVNHSPIGLAKGIIKALQTKNMYVGDMRQAIKDYHKTEYIKQFKDATSEFKFDEKTFMDWANTHLSAEVVSALNGDYTAIKNVFNQYVELGRVNQNVIGSSDMFARAITIESITQGLTGTAWMALGLILGALCKGFKIDDDDYLGPVLTIGDLRIKLDDLSPFSTMFSVGAIINSSDGFLDGFEQFASIIVDASMLNVVGSAIQYSDNLVDYLGNQQINFVQQFIPAIFKSFTKVIDNSKKNKSGNFYQKLIKTTASNLPFFSFLVADKIDPYTGEKDKIYQSGLLEALFHTVLPVNIRPQKMTDFEREARKIGAETTGLTGRFSVNDKNYKVKDTEKYSKYRAEYINAQFGLITSGKLKVTVEDDNGKRITTTYNKLTDKQKKNVINRLYTEATSMTKIKWWTDQGNKYVVTDRNLYNEYRKIFRNILYKSTWKTSKFVES